LTKAQNGEAAKEMQEGEQRLLQAYEIYNSLSNGKLEDFNKVKEYLAKTLESMLEEGKIGPGVVLSSRIKAPASVVQNWRLGRVLDDIFGITLITTTQQEIDEIRARLRNEERFNTTFKKSMSEKRGYEAIHFLFNVGDRNNKTKVECHMQTYENYANVYPHALYKIRRRLCRDLTQQEEQQIKIALQGKYDSQKLLGRKLSNGRSCNVPRMWVTSFNGQGKMEEQELSEEIILTIMYPFLDFSKKRQLERILPQNGEDELYEEK